MLFDKKFVYLPQMVFAELNTSSNYNDDKERKRNGCNGVGIKLANIFSKKLSKKIFTVSVDFIALK